MPTPGAKRGMKSLVTSAICKMTDKTNSESTGDYITDDYIMELWPVCSGYPATRDTVIEFAKKLYDKGWEDGYDQGCFECTGGQ